MNESSDIESYSKGHRTFDCPWCGAIAGIDPSHVGEHFECPECHKSTKLTPQNTRQRHMTEPPKEAPHLEEPGEKGAAPKAAERPTHHVSDWEAYGKGHLTFDCPWCGAISGVDPSHVGEHFECPECSKKTKLTPDNTRSTPVTVPAADGPPHEEKGSKAPLVIGAVALVAVIAVVVGLVASSSGEGDEAGDGPPPVEVAGQPGTPPADVAPPVEPLDPAVPEPAVPEPAVPEPAVPEPAVPEPAVPEPAVPEPAVPEPAVPDPLEVARAAVGEAERALAAWDLEHADEMEVLRVRIAGEQLNAESERIFGGLAEDEVTAARIREGNAAMRTFIADEPMRVQVVEYLLHHLNREGVKPVIVETWEELNFYEPRVREAFASTCAMGRDEAVAERAALVDALEKARAAAGALEAPEDEPEEAPDGE